MNASSVGNTTLPATPAGKRERLEFVGKQLQAVWLKHILKTSRSNDASLMNNSMASKMFNDMFDEVMAEKLAERDVLGIVDKIIDRYSENKVAPESVTLRAILAPPPFSEVEAQGKKEVGPKATPLSEILATPELTRSGSINDK